MKIANKILLLFLVSFLIIRVASADGWHLSDQQVHLLEPNQKAVISWDGENESMILSSAVKSDEIANFAWIIPIQSSAKPEVMAGNVSIFEDLVEYFKKEEPYRGGITIGAIEPGVMIVESKEIGVYDVTIIKATSSDDLISWLNNNGYKVPEKAKPILEKYIAKGDYYFIANKIDLANRFNEDTIDKYNLLMNSGFDESSGTYFQETLFDTYKFPLFKKMLSYNILCNQDFSLKSRYFPDFFDPAKQSNLEKIGISNSKYIELNTIYGVNDGFCKSLLEVRKNHSYLFSWDEIPGNDTGRFVEFLKKNYYGIDWVNMAKIEKIDNGRIINVSAGKNFLSLQLYEKKGEVILKIDDGRSWKFIAMKSGKVNVYKYSDFVPPYVNYADLYPPYDEVPFPNENIKDRYNMIYKEISLILDPIQEIHFLMSDLRKGMSTPLKFEFQPHQPYYPLEISSLNAGQSNIEVYVLADRNVTDKNGVLKVDEFKRTDFDLRMKIQKYINLTHAWYVTRLSYKGDFGGLAADAEFTSGQPTTFAVPNKTSEAIAETPVVKPTMSAVPNKTSDAIAETPKETPIDETSGFEIVLAMTVFLLATMIKRKRNQISRILRLN